MSAIIVALSVGMKISMAAAMIGNQATAAALRGAGQASAKPTSSTASFRRELPPAADRQSRAMSSQPVTRPPTEHS